MIVKIKRRSLIKRIIRLPKLYRQLYKLYIDKPVITILNAVWFSTKIVFGK